MGTIDTRFKILAFLVISSNMPKEFDRKINIVAMAIDRGSEFAEKMLNLVEYQVLNYLDN